MSRGFLAHAAALDNTERRILSHENVPLAGRVRAAVGSYTATKTPKLISGTAVPFLNGNYSVIGAQKVQKTCKLD